MQAPRLMRLMRLMIELARQEFRAAEDIYQPLGISRSQFYRDKEALEKMGFAFTFQRQQGVFAVDHDPGVKLEGLTLSEVLALILAVERLPETGDFTLAFSALTALRKITVDHPGPVADFITKAVEDVVAQEAYGVEFDMLETLVEIVNEKRRVHLIYRPDGSRERRLNVDPVALVFRGGRLFLEVEPGSGNQRYYRAAFVRELIPTPFLSPDQA